MPAKSQRLVTTGFFILSCLLWSQSRYAQLQLERNHQITHGVYVKRISHDIFVFSSAPAPSDPSLYQNQCRPLLISTADQCSHVAEFCPSPETVLSVNYLEKYFCTSPRWRPLRFFSLTLWLVFLFSTLGITASDFFTPNLATIALLFGLDENVAGVTFLAFGNGSPDVFSTFSAMRANSGSLAIGELIGSASFIISCVVGSMCIIKPFKVSPGPFLRDVGFFTIAVSILLAILIDGRIEAWEAGVLVALYILYVIVVVLGTWWDRRQEWKRQHEALIRAEYQEEPFYEPYLDEPNGYFSASRGGVALLSSLIEPQSINAPPNRLRVQTDFPQRTQKNESPSSAMHHTAQLPSFSLIGALEFRQVVASLQQRASAPSLSMFETPITPFAGGRYRNYPGSRDRTPHVSLLSREEDPFDTALGLQRLHSPTSVPSPVPEEQSGTSRLVIPATQVLNSSPSSVPLILQTPPSPDGNDDSQPGHANCRGKRALSVLGHAAYVLFPSLHHFREQFFVGKVASVFATPAILCLTLTLPVVVTPCVSNSWNNKLSNPDVDSRLVDFEEEGIERVLIAEEEVLDDFHGIEFNKWLAAAQCVLGPLFSVAVLAQGMQYQSVLLVAALFGGLTAAISVMLFCEKGNSPLAKMIRCSAGFFVAIVWILAIADEVVSVLRTFGLIFGLSDAIIGLTIFAMGNSLADLVANTSIAAFAPIMGFSACFGSPMLNILLGIGLSGTFVTHKTSAPFEITFSSTLFVSSVGLLLLLGTTLIFVPLNNYYLTRRWGFFLIFAYLVLILINVTVELRHESTR